MGLNKVFIGSNAFVNCDVILSIEGTPLFRLEAGTSDGSILVDLNIRDPGKGKGPVLVTKNVPKSLPEGIGFSSLGRAAELKSAETVMFRVEHGEAGTYVSLDLRPLGLEIFTEPDGTLHVGASTMAGNRIMNAGVGISISHDK